MKIENAAIVLLLLGMLTTVLCGGINLYRLCHSLPYLPHWWSGVCCTLLLFGVLGCFWGSSK